jgi:hypothetical protein
VKDDVQLPGSHGKTMFGAGGGRGRDRASVLSPWWLGLDSWVGHRREPQSLELPPCWVEPASHLFGEMARDNLDPMSYLGTPGRDPRVNQQIVEEQHRIEQGALRRRTSPIRCIRPGGSAYSVG